MSDVVIQVDSLWKKYRLGVLGTGTLRHDFNRWLHRVAGKPDPYAVVGQAPKIEDRRAKSGDRTAKIEDRRAKIEPPSPAAGAALSPISDLLSPSSSLRDDEMWALRDISFEVKQGEILGIIGRNGAGKSTLLKILSRVTAPTSGEVRVKGRIASLLEVGTGFHPELTGRENIFLNGAILGMTKAEIKGKLDEIVAFAEIEKFLDTPVKRYSSGMYVRLAFAVAAHLEPEILILDEVLAVGDAAFLDKCFGRMQSVAKSGRTVLLVSHNMGAIRRMATRALLLEKGQVVEDGPVAKAVEGYWGVAEGDNSLDLSDFPDRGGSGQVRILCLSYQNEAGMPVATAACGGALIVQVMVEFKEAVTDPLFQILITSMGGDNMLDLRSSQGGFRAGSIRGRFVIEMKMNHLPLAPGRYAVSPCVMDRSESLDLDFVRRASILTVSDVSPYPSGASVNSRMCQYVAMSSWREVPVAMR